MESNEVNKDGGEVSKKWFQNNFIGIMLCPLFLFLFRDLSFGIRKLHQIHFVFLLILFGY